MFILEKIIRVVLEDCSEHFYFIFFIKVQIPRQKTYDYNIRFDWFDLVYGRSLITLKPMLT